MIEFYNAELERFLSVFGALPKLEMLERIDSFATIDQTKINWTQSLKEEMGKRKRLVFEPASLVPSLYRPFTKQRLYYNRRLNERVYQMPSIFAEPSSQNLAILINAKYNGNGCLALISNALPDLHCNGDSQCFPLYLYEEINADEACEPQSHLFASAKTRTRRDAITDNGLAHFQSAYPGETITKEDLFYYVYGLLHSPDYRERYADNLSKELPRIPRVKSAADFWSFSNAGRDLADLHLNYETVPMYADAKIDSGGKTLTDADYRVEKMKYGKRGKDKDLTTLIYNAKITVTGIPLAAYDYVVNGKPALDWVVERQCVKTDKDSGIVNDANDWAIETMNNPRYPLELFLRVITVSLETMRIVRSLPALDILPN